MRLFLLITEGWFSVSICSVMDMVQYYCCKKGLMVSFRVFSLCVIKKVCNSILQFLPARGWHLVSLFCISLMESNLLSYCPNFFLWCPFHHILPSMSIMLKTAIWFGIFASRWNGGVFWGQTKLRRHRRDGPGSGAQLTVGWPWAQGDAAEEVQRPSQPAAVRVPEEEEEREATEGRSVGADGLVEHALPLAVPYGNILTTHIFDLSLPKCQICDQHCSNVSILGMILIRWHFCRKRIRWGWRRWLG